MTRPLALDLFCGAGGASMGLHRAGFDVIGVDNRKQPRYPFHFVQADALNPPFDLSRFDLIWASPPCQAFTLANNRDKRGLHPNLIPATRQMLGETRAVTIIENVPGAPIRCDLALDGTMFPELRVIRRRHFELSFPSPFALGFPTHRLVSRHGWASPTNGGGNSSHSRAGRLRNGLKPCDTVRERAAAMGIDWTHSRPEVGNAIPPAYSEFIGQWALQHLANAPKVTRVT